MRSLRFASAVLPERFHFLQAGIGRLAASGGQRRLDEGGSGG